MRRLIGGLIVGLALAVGASPVRGAVPSTGGEHAESCHVAGLVTDHHGRPIAHAVVSLLRDGEAQEVVVTAASDRSGRFALSRLAPGVYRFLAAARGFQTFISERTALAPGRPAQLHLTLRPAPDAKTSGVNPVKYQNRRNRGLFNVAPAADAAASGVNVRAAALASSTGYGVQTLLDAAPGVEVGALLQRDWEGRNTTVGGALRYTTDRRRMLVRVVADQAASPPAAVADDAGLPSGAASPPALFRRTALQAADAWQAAETLQVVYGFDYVHLGRGRADVWRPRLAAQWRPCGSFDLHAALTPDGRAVPDWTDAEGLLFPDDFPTPPRWVFSDGDGPTAARNLRAEAGVVWRTTPNTTVNVFAYQDRLDGHPLVAAAQTVVRVDGRASGGGFTVAHRPHRRVTVTAAYAAGRAPGLAPTGELRPATTYHVVAVVAEATLPALETRLSLGYRAAYGAAVHAIDPFTARLPWTESGLSLAFIQTLPAWLTPPGRWEAVVEGRNLDERRGEITGVGALFGFPHRRWVRGGLRVRF